MDPIKVTPERLLNPQGLNLYAYTLNNPLKYIDPTGKYNVETGEIEKGDTEKSITKAVNKALNIKTTWKKIAEVSFFKDKYKTTKVSELLKLDIPISCNTGTNEVKDITKQLDNLNVSRAKELSESITLLFNTKLINFLDYFAPNHKWDIKNSNDPIMGGGANNRTFWAYIYHGELIRYDAPANINYGYVGHSIGLSLDVLLSGALFEQGVDDGTFSLQDNEGDGYYVQKGYNLYTPPETSFSKSIFFIF